MNQIKYQYISVTIVKTNELVLLGFKANQVHKKCLVDRNITLTTVFGADYLTSNALPDNIKSLLETEIGNAVYTDGISNITFPNCNLEEELDNVSRVIFTTFMIIFAKFSSTLISY